MVHLFVCIVGLFFRFLSLVLGCLGFRLSFLELLLHFLLLLGQRFGIFALRVGLRRVFTRRIDFRGLSSLLRLLGLRVLDNCVARRLVEQVVEDFVLLARLLVSLLPRLHLGFLLLVFRLLLFLLCGLELLAVRLLRDLFKLVLLRFELLFLDQALTLELVLFKSFFALFFLLGGVLALGSLSFDL